MACCCEGKVDRGDVRAEQCNCGLIPRGVELSENKQTSRVVVVCRGPHGVGWTSYNHSSFGGLFLNL